MFSKGWRYGTASKSSTESLLALNTWHGAGTTHWGALHTVKFFWRATSRCSGWCNLICLSCQLSEVTFFWDGNLGQLKGVFSGILKDTRAVEYSLSKGTNIGAVPEQSGVGIWSQYFQLTWEIHWASTPSQGGSLHSRSCQNTACAMSHNTINSIKHKP